MLRGCLRRDSRLQVPDSPLSAGGLPGSQVLRIMGQCDPDVTLLGETDLTLPPIIFGRKLP